MREGFKNMKIIIFRGSLMHDYINLHGTSDASLSLQSPVGDLDISNESTWDVLVVLILFE